MPDGYCFGRPEKPATSALRRSNSSRRNGSNRSTQKAGKRKKKIEQGRGGRGTRFILKDRWRRATTNRKRFNSAGKWCLHAPGSCSCVGILKSRRMISHADGSPPESQASWTRGWSWARISPFARTLDNGNSSAVTCNISSQSHTAQLFNVAVSVRLLIVFRPLGSQPNQSVFVVVVGFVH